MGTSQSSTGPGSGVPLVPPWADEPDVADPGEPPEEAPSGQGPPDGATAPALAPAARFGACRTALGSYATSGDRADLRRSLGAYTRRGYGGAGNLSRRFGGTARTADGAWRHPLRRSRRRRRRGTPSSPRPIGTRSHRRGRRRGAADRRHTRRRSRACRHRRRARLRCRRNFRAQTYWS